MSRRIPAAVLAAAGALALCASCGASDSASSARPSDGSTAGTTAAASTAAPSIVTGPVESLLLWLVADEPPDGMQLTSADEHDYFGCGQAADCAPTGTEATLRYESLEPPAVRNIAVAQAIVDEGQSGPVAPPYADRRAAKDRQVDVVETIDGLDAWWLEPGDLFVHVTAFGAGWEQVADLIERLRPAESAEWASLMSQPVQQLPCVAPGKLYAPKSVPDGWQQFVLQARRAGSCGSEPMLMLSLVEPGIDMAHPGKLATIGIGPVNDALPISGNETVEWGGRSVTLQRYAATVGGQTAMSAGFVESGVVVQINATGLNDDELRMIVESIGEVDAAQWQAMVDSIEPAL